MPNKLQSEDGLLKLIIDQEPESLTLDYKKSDALGKDSRRRNEISKDVSAFANSAGGMIIYGIDEDGHIPKLIDSGVDPDDLSKEWLEQVINSTIQQRIEGIQIRQIWLTSTSPGKVAYAVDIPRSMRAPHMASDNKFYKRYNYESRPMEEYEVRDVANRAVGPILRFRPTLEFYQHGPQDDQGFSYFFVKGYMENESNQPAEYIQLNVLLDPGLMPNSRGTYQEDKFLWPSDKK